MSLLDCAALGWETDMASLATTASTTALTASIERRLGLRRRARADGAAGKPGPDDASDAEADIAAAILAEQAPLLAERIGIAQRLETVLRRHAPPSTDFALLAAQSRLPMAQIETRRRSELTALRTRAAAERADVETFRRIEDRVFGAKLPESSILSTGLLVALMAVEAIASAPIFASVNETGLVNGYVTAIVMSALNAVIGFLGGFFGVRYTAHARPGPRAMGHAAAALSVASAAAFNVFMAWWRADAEAAANPGDATSWLGLLATGPSITLIMLGGIVFLMALYEGATKFGEAYPGYGKFERHAQDAEADFREALDELAEEMHAVVDPVIEKMNARVDEHQAAVARMLHEYDVAAGRIVDIDAKLRALQATHLALVTLYRQENAAHRADAPPRAFLATPAPLPPAPDVLEPAGVLLEEAKAAFAAAQAAANREIGELIRALQEAGDRMEGQRPETAGA
ncbi:MAG: hypothetical protein NW200_09365 [Hyphomonadaceae bacterium]|nr:hypothetical protein [Hyphomonadaceae bacterium]